MSRLPVVRAPMTTNKNVQFSNFCGPKPVKTGETVQRNMLVNTVLSNFPALRSTKVSIIVPFTDKTRKRFTPRVLGSIAIPPLSSSRTHLPGSLYHHNNFPV